MAKDLRNRKGPTGTKSSAKKQKSGSSQEEYIRKIIEQNQGKSKAELEKELFETARAQKQAGQFDPDALENFMRSVSPMLTPEQRARMEILVHSLQNGD